MFICKEVFLSTHPKYTFIFDTSFNDDENQEFFGRVFCLSSTIKSYFSDSNSIFRKSNKLTIFSFHLKAQHSEQPELLPCFDRNLYSVVED